MHIRADSLVIPCYLGPFAIVLGPNAQRYLLLPGKFLDLRAITPQIPAQLDPYLRICPTNSKINLGFDLNYVRLRAKIRNFSGIIPDNRAITADYPINFQVFLRLSPIIPENPVITQKLSTI